MIANIIRKSLTFLSFPHIFNNEVLNKKKISTHLYLREKALKLKNKNINKLQTHSIFSNEVLNLIIKSNLKDFLRKNFIQKMFFVHNRLYLKYFLLNIHQNRKLTKLLLENKIGNPVPYFLYKKSSGNRIRHVYHLYKYLKYNTLDTDLFIEIGGGFGCMSDILQKHTGKKNKYIIFDTEEVSLLQYYYLKNLNYNVGFNSLKYNIILVSDIKTFKSLIKKYKNKKKFLISNWAFSELPQKLRKNLDYLFLISDKFLISFQNNFEDINNFNYFSKLKDKVNYSKIIKITEMSKFSKNNHFYFFK